MNRKLLAVSLALATTGMVVSCVTEPEAHAFAYPRIQAHRMTWVGGPTENSTKALATVGKHASVLETDVRETKDHKLVLMHDATISRTTRGTGKVANRTLKQLKAVRTNDGSRIPTVAQLASYMRSHPTKLAVIELKVTLSPQARALFIKRLRPVRSRVILYDQHSGGNARASKLAKALGGQSAYWVHGDLPSASTVRKYGRYLYKSPTKYPVTQRLAMLRDGVRFIGWAGSVAGYIDQRNAGAYIVSTEVANKL